MWRLADRQLDEFLANGECEFISEYSKPFATLGHSKGRMAGAHERRRAV